MKCCVAHLLLAVGALATELPCEVSWVGNDLNGNPAWVLQDIDDLCVTPEGDVFTNIGWEEGGGNVMHFDREGAWQGAAMHTHGWGYGGGAAVAANTRYIFIAQQVENEKGHLSDASTWPAKGLRWQGVSRRLRSDFRQGAPFPGGKGGKGGTIKGSFKPVAETSEDSPEKIRGLWASDAELFVAVKNEGVIRVYDTESMEELRAWQAPRPDRMVMDGRGMLWVLLAPEDEQKGAWILAGFERDGGELGRLTLDAAVRPADLAVDTQGRLLVSDTGVSQQILLLDGVPQGKPRLCGTFGNLHGVFGGPVAGRTGEQRFNHPCGVGADADGNLYVASSGGTGGGSTVLESYAPDGKLRWRRTGLFFVDLADLDTESERSIYSKEERFTVDFSRAAGEQTTYAAYTVNPWKYPHDPRLHIWSANAWFLRLQEVPLLLVSNMGQDFVQAYRFNAATDGETAIPAALVSKKHVKPKTDGWPHGQPEAGAWCWTDRNGDGAMQSDEYDAIGREGGGCMFADDRGTLWRVFREAVYGAAFKGFTPQGAPQWAWQELREIPRPAELSELRRFKIDAARDIAAFGGDAGEDKHQHWKPMGPAVAVYRDLLRGPPVKLWSKILPYSKGSQGHESAEPMSFEIAGDYLFVCYTRGLKTESIRNAFVKVLRLTDGEEIGNLVPERVTGELGLLDLEDALRVRQLRDGSYLLFLEDDYKAKNVMMRWKPESSARPTWSPAH